MEGFCTVESLFAQQVTKDDATGKRSLEYFPCDSDTLASVDDCDVVLFAIGRDPSAYFCC